jgi:hypothetical protein
VIEFYPQIRATWPRDLFRGGDAVFIGMLGIARTHRPY